MPVNPIHSINNTIYLMQRIVVSQSIIHKITKGREDPGIRLNESCSQHVIVKIFFEKYYQRCQFIYKNDQIRRLNPSKSGLTLTYTSIRSSHCRAARDVLPRSKQNHYVGKDSFESISNSRNKNITDPIDRITNRALTFFHTRVY